MRSSHVDDYGNSLFAGLPACDITGLQSVQNAAARLFGGISMFESVHPVFIDVLHWLPVGERITFKVSLLTYKALHGLTPSYLTDMLVPVASNPALCQNRSADRGNLVVPRVKNTSYGYHSFSIAAPRLWNTLLCELRSSLSVTTFHTNLKTYLFRTAYKISASNY